MSEQPDIPRQNGNSEQPASYQPDTDTTTAKEERLRQIAKARRDVTQLRAKARQTDNDQALVAYRAELESFLLELQPLFLQTDEGKELWNNHDFGTLTITPPTKDGRIVDPNDPNKTYSYGGGLPEQEYELTGLNSLLEYDNPIPVTFRFVGRHNYNARTRTISGKKAISHRYLDTMLEATNEYLNTIGLTVNVEEDSGPYEI